MLLVLFEEVKMDDTTNKIALLNDVFRKSMWGGRVVQTQGIASLPPEDQAKMIEG